ncbi:hypothetical protein NSPZN2_30272 [Nitrospira defluvii]|uniref:Uncharacterized protein n=1 Tax=Nitrospira defluvii TaxID=330214 RepID=A0ABM8RHK5_9BACT|nr:hypothetical protein NSPZN2_30272 [Nitrospira defluvii]
METLWYAILISVLTVYVVLDGYDVGVAMLVPFVAQPSRNEAWCEPRLGLCGQGMRCG